MVVRTPAYCDTAITDAVQVFIELLRPSDGTVSNPETFTYFPVLQGLFLFFNVFLSSKTSDKIVPKLKEKY